MIYLSSSPTDTPVELRVRIDAEYCESLQQILEIYDVYSPDLLEFLTAMLRVYPEDRLSARQLQKLSWLRQ